MHRIIVQIKDLVQPAFLGTLGILGTCFSFLSKPQAPLFPYLLLLSQWHSQYGFHPQHSWLVERIPFHAPQRPDSAAWFIIKQATPSAVSFPEKCSEQQVSHLSVPPLLGLSMHDQFLYSPTHLSALKPDYLTHKPRARGGFKTLNNLTHSVNSCEV